MEILKHENMKRLIADCTISLLNKNISIRFEHQKNLTFGALKHISGLFDSTPKPILYTATNKSFYKWSQIFAHEYNHAIQYFDKTPIWEKYANYPHSVDSWLTSDDGEIDDNIVGEIFEVVQSVELECEMMTSKLLTEYEVFNQKEIENYNRAANAYVLSYNVIRSRKDWFAVPFDSFKIANEMKKEISSELISFDEMSEISKDLFNKINNEYFKS